MKKEHDYMWYEVTYSHQHYGRRPTTGSKRNRKWTDKQVSGRYIIARRARLFSDKEQEALCGRLQIAGTGTFQRHYHKETWRQKERYKVKRGDQMVTKTRWVNKSRTSDNSDCKLDHFFYKMHAYGTDFNIQYHEKASGSWFESNTLTFQASHEQSGVPLFKVVSDGKAAASLETYSQSDPVDALLAAFAISIKLEPKEFHSVCGSYCKGNFSLDSHAGQVGGFGLTDVQYEAAWPVAPTAVAVPQAGYSYGIPLDGLPMAVPVVSEGVVPMTYVAPVATPVAWSMPAYEPIPMAIPVAMPVIADNVAIPVSDGASDDSWKGDGDDEGDGGSDDDGGDDNDDGPEDGAFDMTPVPMATPLEVQYAEPIWALPMATPI
eukprot:CAMPEP_0115851382 /NCGR_PEP_ID=MMETSP0287-20121206/12454_1 /TAXON_ID=412157 /ORGANISM="Chrysochromulina rotalis, Strain UIO044" /LENGTH=376 /DNA_ID=CAMNT_0003305415 /DNA_START=140 /DNA_END=1270 /DNA_ORIENTATION=+